MDGNNLKICVCGLTMDVPGLLNLWTMKATLDSYSFVIQERVSKDRVKVVYST